MTRQPADVRPCGPALPMVLFSYEASAVAPHRWVPEWVRATRSPLEHLTWQGPPTHTDRGGTA